MELPNPDAEETANKSHLERQPNQNQSLAIASVVFAILFFIATPFLLSSEASDFTFFFLLSIFFAFIALALSKKKSLTILAFAIGILACAGAALETSRSMAGISILEDAVLKCGLSPHVDSDQIQQLRARLRWAFSASLAAQAGRPQPPMPTTTPSP